MDGDFSAGAGVVDGFAAGFTDLADLAGAAGFAIGFGAALELAVVFPVLAVFLFWVAMGFWGG
jgi:hypothetical protein